MELVINEKIQDSDCRIFQPSISFKSIKQYLRSFFKRNIMLEKEISETLIAHDQVCPAKFKLAGICKNLTLNIANIFSTV